MSDSVSTEVPPVAEATEPQVPAEQPQAAPPSAAPSTVPTVGRIVHYRRRVKRGVQVLPGVILSVQDATTVNLKVMLDSAAPDLFLAGVRQGDGAGCWNWPVRS